MELRASTIANHFSTANVELMHSDVEKAADNMVRGVRREGEGGEERDRERERERERERDVTSLALKRASKRLFMYGTVPYGTVPVKKIE